MLRFLVSKLLRNNGIIYSRACSVPYIIRPSRDSTSCSEDQQSLTVSYLTDSCGLSLERAILASKNVNIEKTEKPDMVLQLLRAHGFTKSHISCLISKLPLLILADPTKTLKPKIEFFESLGIVGPHLPRILCANSIILMTSLKNRILPTVDFYRGFLETDGNVICALKRFPKALSLGVEGTMANISTLRAYGVPEINIRKQLLMQPQPFFYRVDLFQEIVREVGVIGFEPMRMSFLYAVRAMSCMKKSNWLRKKELIMSFGWSEREFLSAFRLQPFFMITSEKKIKELMEFYSTKLSLGPSDIVKCPHLFLVSLEKRIMPRCSLLEALLSKGLIKNNVNITSAMTMGKKQFEKKFFASYKEDFPELIKAYQLEIRIKGFGRI